jgi:hypothetical protein
VTSWLPWDALSVGMPRSQIGMKPTHSGSLLLWLGQMFPFRPMSYGVAPL